MPDNLTLVQNGFIATLRLNRPVVKNALDSSALIQAICG